MKNIFNSVKMTSPKSNVFDLSHDVKLSLNAGQLVPTAVIECVPGDRFNIGCESLIRLAPMVSPMMHRVNCFMHYFFVPNRIVWPNWERYITNTKDDDGNLPAFPTLPANDDNATEGSLMDYFGIPPYGAQGGSDEVLVSAIPFAAYQKIYDEYYRDQNLIDSDFQELVDGDNNSNEPLQYLRRRAWEHDYFTAALPFAQKGDPVNIPLGEFNDVPVYINQNSVGATLTGTPNNATVPPADPFNPDFPAQSLVADTSELVDQQTTINDLRRAFKLQEWLEKAARGGSRYIENILVHFGVRSSDKRLQRPEYITGAKSPVVISEVLNTTGTDEAPQGEMAGHGVSTLNGHMGNYYCEEHGYIIGIMSILPRTAYQNGIARHFLKVNDPFEFFWPSFANIGEQEVLQDEVFAYSANGKETFGYVPRYAEYKFQNSRVAGEFRSSLDHWNWGRQFGSNPALTQEFIECNPDYRPFAVTDDTVAHFYCHIYHQIRAVRKMPKYGTPTF